MGTPCLLLSAHTILETHSETGQADNVGTHLLLQANVVRMMFLLVLSCSMQVYHLLAA